MANDKNIKFESPSLKFLALPKGWLVYTAITICSVTICVSSLDPFSSPFQPKKITWIQKAWLGTTSHWAGGIVTMLWLYGEHALMCPFPLYICSCNRAVVMCNCCCEMLEQAHHYHIVISIRKEWQCAFTQESIILSSNWPASKSFKCVEMAIIFMIVIKRPEHKSIFFTFELYLDT